MPDFIKLFAKYKNNRIAIYGLGYETERLLQILGDKFNIIGLLDSFRHDGTLFGKDILSLQQAADDGVELIIIVARPGSCKAIAKNIGQFCKEKGILLFDCRGKDMLQSQRIMYDFSKVFGYKISDLKSKIDSADIVSFDFFDTIVARKVLSYTDVFELVDIALNEKGIHIDDFSIKRLEIEKALSIDSAPTLVEIYKRLLERNFCDIFNAEELATLEFNIDLKLICPRYRMIDMYNYCMENDKEVYIITDTYYSQVQIKRIMQKFSIRCPEKVIVSSEFKVDKRHGLFSVLKNLDSNNTHRKCLHIGDDEYADIKAAEDIGISTFRIYSPEFLFDSLGDMGLETHVSTIADKIKVGLFIAKLFNNPFWFEDHKRKVGISNAYDLSYLLFAPIIADFVIWFYEEIQQDNIENIWLSSRDGFIIKKLYTMLDKTVIPTYFMTSRIAALRAGIETDDDIMYEDKMKFSGKTSKRISVRFGIEIDGDNDYKVLKDDIYCIAKHHRKNYLKYISKLNLRRGKIAFFDFVAKGTTQMYVRRLVKNEIVGFYFLRLDPDSIPDKQLNVKSFYSNATDDGSVIYNDYYVLEAIMTAPHPSVLGFNEDGEPIFGEETRTVDNIACFNEMQKGIVEYFKDYLNLLPKKYRNINRELDENMLELLHKISIADKTFLSLMIEDAFFNRMTPMIDLI